MAQKITRNTFEGGLNADLDKAKTAINQYLEAHNVDLVGDGKFLSLRNIKGTLNVQNIQEDGVCIGSTRARFLIGGVLKESIVVFTVIASVRFNIWAYDIEGGQLYAIFEETVDSDYLTNSRVIDAKNYPENGVDIVYFTDFYNEIRKFRCEIPSPYTPNFLNKQQLSLQKRGANGHVELSDIVQGGSLLSGTYQFVYRMSDPASKTFSKWSTPSTPFHVYDKVSTTTIVNSGVGMPTPFKLVLNVIPSQDEIDNYGYFQLGVIENVGVSIPTTVSLLPIQPTSALLNYSYSTNDRIGSVSIEDVVVDLAAIDTAKTLNISRNRLFAGNIKYKSLAFDMGTPTVLSGFVSVQTSDVNTSPFSNHSFSSRSIGYFRDEVYRFGIVCEDEFGNRTPVKVLDMSNVAGNQITSGLIDMKFPSRSSNNNYTLFETNGKIQSLGVTITVSNLPTYTRKVEIVRVKRKKNILFQSPLIPCTTVEGTGAIENYPNTIEYDNGAGLVQKTYPDAQPMTSTGVLIPKNMLIPEARQIVKRNQPNGSGLNTSLIGEVYYTRRSAINSGVVFPPQTMYADVPFENLGNEKFQIVDYAFLRADIKNYSPVLTPAVVCGDHANTNVSATFYALSDDQYYFDNTYIGKTISIPPIPIVDYEAVETSSTGVTLSGKSAVRYGDLQTKGVDFGFEPDNQKMSLISWGVGIDDPAYVPLAFKGGSNNGFSPGGYISGGSGIQFEGTSLTNKYVNEYTNYINNSSLISPVAIVNVVTGLTDYRYGDVDTEYEFISTGCVKTFTPSEIAALQSGSNPSFGMTVYGGDCFTGVHTFKISDSTYSITNQGKNNGATDTQSQMVKKWNNLIYTHTGLYGGTTRIPMCLPYAVENVGQLIQVVMESEYNGDVLDYDILSESLNVNGIPVRYLSNKDKVRVPLTYSYNKNLSRENDEKVYVPKPRFAFEQNVFGARVVYSELKIYNSSEQGFDTFKVLNFYDLEEKRYNITKLALAGDDLYAMQERGIVYLPTSQNQLEQTDAGSIAVGTADVIGRPIVVDSERGSRHLRGIVETGQVIYIPDNVNKAIYVLSGQQLNSISDNGVDSIFRSIFENSLPENSVIGVYDYVRKQYWIVDNQNYNCYIFNEKLGVWVCNYEFNAGRMIHAGVYNDQNLFLIGRGVNDGGELAVYKMYAGVNNELMGDEVVPRVTISINPDEPYSKTLDNIMVASTDRLDTVDVLVSREQAQGNQVVSGMNLDVTPIEGNYRIKALLDSNNSRLRGLNFTTTIKWRDNTAAVSSVDSKYRLSARTPF